MTSLAKKLDEPERLLPERTVRALRRRLRAWGRAHRRQFAWRSEPDPWLTLVAEFLLQRTRAVQVEPVFEQFRAAYPTAAALVVAGPDAAQRVTARLGIHWRGPLLYELAGAVAKNHGRPPESMPELRRLTGIGPYTAAAWLSLHRGKRAVLVDSNISRWLSRLTGRRYHRDPRHVAWINELAGQLTPARAHADYNYAVLDFTMTVCVPGRPRCGECPIRPYCAYGTHHADLPSRTLASSPSAGSTPRPR
ncbi:MAG: hypothetical protein M3464_19045 [Chloroflexota bacterium]|nr:hypothetical protein [Chloroflexota bacterium]